MSESRDDDLCEAVADGLVAFEALVNAYRDAKAAGGASAALTGLFSTLANDTDHAVLVAMMTAVVAREEAPDA